MPRWRVSLLVLALLGLGGGAAAVHFHRRAPEAERFVGRSELERTAYDVATNALAQEPGLRGSRLLSLRCDDSDCEIEASHADRAAQTGFQRWFPHRMGRLFPLTTLRSDPVSLRTRARLSGAAQLAR